MDSTERRTREEERRAWMNGVNHFKRASKGACFYFGMSRWEYQNAVRELMTIQRGKCAICQKDITNKYHLDHDHETGIIRGLLCPRCNQGLGYFADDPFLFRIAIAYVKYFKKLDVEMRPLREDVMTS